MTQHSDQRVSTTFDAVSSLVVETLGITDRAATLTPSSALLDGVPEFDSMAVVEVVTRIEERFGIAFGGEDFSPETFETFGTLSDVVDDKLR